jgi:hypothetical protein
MVLPQHRLTSIALSLVNILLALPIAIYAAATPYTRHAYDDFCSAVVSREHGPLGAVGWWYNNMNGRFVAFFLNSATTLVGAPIAPLLTACFLLLWWAALFSLFQLWLRQRPYAGMQAALMTSLLLLATLSSLPYIATALYWYTGVSMYLPSVAMFTAYAWYALRPQAPNKAALMICAVLPFLVAGASDIGGLVQTLMLVIATVLSFKFRRLFEMRRSRLLVGLAGSVFGFVLVLYSPGNAFRTTLFTKPDLGTVFAIVISSPGAPVVVSFLNSPLAMLAVFLVPALAAFYAPFASSQIQRKQARLGILLLFVAAGVLIAACFAPVAYFLSVGLVEHAWIIPMYIFLGGLTAAGYLCGLSIRSLPAEPPNRWKATVVVLLALFGLWSSWQALTVANRQRIYAEAWDKRDADAKAKVNDGAVTLARTGAFVNPYTLPPPDPNARPLVVDSLQQVSPFKWEIGDVPGTVANECLARYYHAAVAVGEPSTVRK